MPVHHHVYLSPHLDDAVLSCGGRINQLAREGQSVLVISVFAGSPQIKGDGKPSSDFGTALHRRWQVDVDAPAARRKEDLAALRVLGAEARHLNFLDCIYRRHPITGTFLYCSEAEIFGQVHPTEYSLAAEVTQVLEKSLDCADRATIYAPLTVGCHVDHQIVAAVALKMLAGGCRVAFYEDYPYAEDGTAFEAAKEWVGSDRWRVERLALEPADLEAKTAAVLRYRSQLSTFFEEGAQVASRLGAFALVRSPHRVPCERLWHLTN